MEFLGGEKVQLGPRSPGQPSFSMPRPQWVNRNNELMIVGDFNCKEVNWEARETRGGRDSWGSMLLEMISDNLMIQIVKVNTRKRGNDEESRLDLVFTKDEYMIGDINYLPPLGTSDHIVMKIKLILGYPTMNNKEEYKEERYNYSKANFQVIKSKFRDMDWREMYGENTVEGMYNVFKQKYEEVISKCVPKRKKEIEREKEWFNARCIKAKEKRDQAWEKARKRGNTHNWEKYRKLRNEYTKIRRQEAANFEKNVVGKVETDPKLFYRYVNGKMKIKDKIIRLRKGDETYDDVESICEVMNNSLHSVFITDEDFIEPELITDDDRKIDTITFQQEEVLKLMKGLDVRKAVGPDGISGWVLKECAEELVGPIYDIMKRSLEDGELPLDWKRANIVPIYKGGSREEPLNPNKSGVSYVRRLLL